MKFVIVAVVTFGLTIGCAPAPPAAAPAGSGGSAKSETAPPPQDFSAVPDAPTVTISDADRPKTTEEFVTEFLRRYKKSMYEPFIELAYWDSSTVAQQREYLAGVKATFWDSSQREVAKITDASDVEIIEIAKYDGAYYPKEGDESVQLQPRPTHVLEITGHFGESASVTTGFAIGHSDGTYYFCTIKHR